MPRVYLGLGGLLPIIALIQATAGRASSAWSTAVCHGTGKQQVKWARTVKGFALEERNVPSTHTSLTKASSGTGQPHLVPKQEENQKYW